MNSIEQHVVVKGGTVCLFGTAEKGYQWSNLGGDYLLSRLLHSKRVKRTLCLNLDRNPTSLTNIAKLVDNSKDDDESGAASSKLVVIGRDVSGIFEVNSTLNAIKTTISEWNQQEFAYSIVVYSLSELILTLGFRKAVSFVKDLVYYVQTEATNSTNATNTCTPSIVFVVHESLHPPSVIEKLRSLVTIIVKVVPNSGTLSPEVVAEMQTIRKSVTTGKIMECIEMFGYREGLLYAMKTGGSAATAGDAENGLEFTEDDAESVVNKNDSSTIMNKLLVPSGGTPTAGAAVEGTSSSSVAAVAVDTSKRLITFDSTDPEFDEDSDPDADLDL